MAGYNQGTWVPRATLAALSGDSTAAILFQQAAWVQDHFNGPFSVSADWWGRMLSMSQKTVRAGLQRLKAVGWIDIRRRGMDPTWWIKLTGNHIEALATAESELEDALLWEARGRRKATNGSSSPQGKQPVPQRASSQLPSGQAEPYSENKETTTGSNHAPSALVPAQRPPRHGAPPATALAGHLVATYPHPGNRGATVRVPSAAAVELQLLDIVRLQAVRLDPATCAAIAEGALREARAAKGAPEAYRRTLRTWLQQFGWQEKHRAPAAQQAPGTSAPPPTSTKSAWDELEQRGNA